MQEVHEATLQKQETLRQHGYYVNIMSECEWDPEMVTNPELRQFGDALEIVDLLELRDAFFGRCTTAVKFHHVADQDEEIKYIDVNKTQEYPIGHPKVIVNPVNQDICHCFGMAKVDILPPYDMYHPVLPHRHKGKLTFPICQACMEQEMNKTPLGKIMPLPAHAQAMHAQRNLVHPRDPEGRGNGIHTRQDPRNSPLLGTWSHCGLLRE